MLRRLLSAFLANLCPLALAAVKVESAATMDRWIDVTWSVDTPTVGGFDVEISSDGRIFTVAEHTGARARAAAVFIGAGALAAAGADGRLHLRVAELDAAGRPRSRSDSVSLAAHQPRDIEAEVRRRFSYWEDATAYRATDPVYTVTYSEAQKREQREATRAMIAELQKAAANGTAPRTYVVPPRIYRVEPGQIRLSGAENLAIQVAGVEIVVDSETSGAAFSFERCRNIVLTGKGNPLIVDSAQLPMSVARIVAVDTTKLTLDIEVLPGYATDLPESERMMAYDARGRLLNIEQMGWKGIGRTDESHFRLTTTALRRPENRERILVPGSLLALHNNSAHQTRTHGVVAARQCEDMTYEGIRVYNGGGAPADHGTAGYTVFRDWRLLPRPGTNRLPIATGLGQFSKNGGTFIFEDCEFGPHLDDGINLLSGMSIVGKSNDGAEVVVTGSQQPTAGSTLTFHDYTSWATVAEAEVVASELVTDPVTLAAVNDFARSQRTRENARHAYRVTLDRAVTLPAFAMVVHSDYRADAIVVRGCLFRDQLAQIMLLQGAKSGLIENNLLLRSTGGGISAQFSQYWWEGPMPGNFLIRNNVFRDNPVALAVNGFAGNASIAVYAGTKHPTTERLLRGFRIEGNTIVNPSVYGIAVRNADEVRIRHNRIVNPGVWDTTESFRGRPIRDLYAAIVLDAVSHAEVTDNEIVFGNPRCRRAVLVDPTCDAATVRVERNRSHDAR